MNTFYFLNKYYSWVVLLILFSLISIKNFSQNCLNFQNISNSSFVTCYYGTYSNPYANIGIVFNRHAVMTNTILKDPHTQNILNVVPPGESYSIKLGNDNTGSQAEAIKYKFRVDTNNFDILIMKYAVVLEDPDHSWYNQPRFRMEILDSNNVLIDSCGFADFFASSALGWNDYNGVVWKNWTNIGIDLTNYHNKLINLRFTTYDCELSGHFGYAYYHLSCGIKNIKQMSCGDENLLVFEAPKGFNYIWYSSTDPDTISTAQTITIPSNNNLYFCRCSSLEDDDCNFTLSVVAQKQYPYADFQYSIDTCQRKITLTNNSVISSSKDSAVGNAPCDSIVWIMPDGSISNQLNQSFSFDTAGVYCFSVIAIINDGVCRDTLNINITIPESMVYKLSFEPYNNTICQGDSLLIKIDDVFSKYIWSNGDTNSSIIINPVDTMKLFVSVFDSYGCESNDTLTINVNPILTTNIIDTICQGETYNLFGFNVDSVGVFTNIMVSIFGCDSIVNLDLKMKPRYNDTIYAEICQGETYSLFGFDEDSTNVYTHSFQSILECDSVVNLNLKVNTNYNDTIYANICIGETYNLFGFNEDSTNVYTHSFQSISGCDSIVNLNLKVNPSFNDTIYGEICQGDTYSLFGFNETSSGLFTRNLISIFGCDSIVNLNLKVNPTFNDTIYAEICRGETYNYMGFQEDSTNFYTHYFQSILGCDSIVNLSLKVNPSYYDTIYAEICSGEIYTLKGFNESNQGIYSLYLTTNNGCDSIVTLNLFVQEMGIYNSIFEEKEIIIEELPITLDARCENCINYYWNTGATQPLYTIYQYGLYIVSYENACGKFYDSILIISPKVNVFIPNSFTPLEITNNIFFPIFVDDEEVYVESFEIFNRWGEKVFSNTKKAWDGTFNGKTVNAGVYIWRLLYKTKYSGKQIHEKKGEVNVII